MRTVLRAACALAVATLAARSAAQQPEVPAAPPGTRPRGEPARAEAPRRPDPPVQLFVSVGAEFGLGDRLAKVVFDDDPDQILHANDGGMLAVGAHFLRLAAGRLYSQATAGVKYASINASNGDLRFVAFPLELLEFASLEPFRVGAGVQLLLGPRLDGDGDFAARDVDYEPALGLVVQADFVWRFRGASRGALIVGPRFLLQTLEVEGGGDVDANALGVALGFEL
jgi:hypothetical protein